MANSLLPGRTQPTSLFKSQWNGQSPIIALRSLSLFVAYFNLLNVFTVLPFQAARATVVAPLPSLADSSEHKLLQFRRSITDTTVCTRWAQQSALVNGTLYLYGGQATTSPGQTANTWNNDFLSLDLTKSWQITSPTIKGLAQPSGPPAVALGYLWSSYTSLFLYGGEYSDNPIESPAPFSLWEYQIESAKWLEFSDPLTSSGEKAPGNEVPVQRVAEGAGFSLAALGRGWYFGGHQDFLTTAGWSIQTPRIYLDSILEYTFPGFSNKDVNILSDGSVAGPQGAWRNVTMAAGADQASFPVRADGVLVYLPGFGDDGLLLGLAGGTNQTFNEMNLIDIYDIKSSTWYKQATNGNPPKYRVNPCAVVAAASDGSSYNVYMYGGQNLTPAGEQIQYSDIWILTVPSFTWIQVDTSDLSNPPARAGHTCNIWDGQMVVVGGFVGKDISCDPGFYVFDLSTLKWSNQFTSISNAKTNPFSQQPSQKGDDGGLEGSYGYEVPVPVVSIIGGGPSGSATITQPIASATAGPLETGSAVTYKLAPSSSAYPSSATGSPSTGPNVGAIIAGVLAGVFGLLAIYLAFCVWLYRKRLSVYKRHADLFHRHANESAPNSSKEQSFTGPRASAAEGRFWNDYHQVGTHYTATPRSSTEDLIAGQEPTFVGIMLHPRRSLRVVNHD